MIIADQTNIIVTTITLNHQYAAPSLGSKEILISFPIGSLALEYWSFHVVDVGKIYLNCRWLHVPYLDLLGLIVKKKQCKSTQRSNMQKMISFFPTVRWCDKLICVFMSSSFSEIKAVSSFPKTKTAPPTEWSKALSAACSAIAAKRSSVIMCSRSSPKMRTTTCKTHRGGGRVVP